MRITKENLTVTSAGYDLGRPKIESILFDRAGTVSADGFRLTFVPYPDGPASEDDQAVGMILPIAAAARIAMVADDDSTINVARALGEGDVFNISVRGIPDVDLGAAALFTFAAVEGPYPSRDKIVPTTFGHEITLNIEYLRDALAAVERMGAIGARLRMNGIGEPILVDAYGSEWADGARPYVVVMPIYAPRHGS